MPLKNYMDFPVEIFEFIDIFDTFFSLLFQGIPVTESGKINSKLLGLITFRDIDFLSKDQWSSMPISRVMTPIDELITAKNDLTLKDAYLILQRSKKGSLFLIKYSFQSFLFD
jgi:IMP dehydrogenase